MTSIPPIITPPELINYPGRKSANGVFQLIFNHLAKSHVLLSPFLGSGAIESAAHYFSAMHAAQSTLVVSADIDEKVYASWMNVKPPNFLVYPFPWLAFLTNHLKIYPNAVLFLDPPYLLSAIRSNKHLYKYNFVDSDMLQLLHFIKDLPQKVMLCHPICDMLSGILTDWRKVPFTYATRQGKGADCLWMNYNPANEQLYTYDYLGDDFTTRQRILKNHKSLTSKFSALSYHEQLKFLAFVKQKSNFINPL